jgi:hypothetical protein
VQCARAGLRLVVLTSIESADDVQARHSWLATLGARVLAVEADQQELRRASASALPEAGVFEASPGDGWWSAGLDEVVSEIDTTGHGDALLAVPGLTGRESDALLAVAQRRAGSVPLPLDGVHAAAADRVIAVVGALGVPTSATSGSGASGGVRGPAGGVITVSVSLREVEAAQRLLAREEGLLVSRGGAVGFAALVRAMREDRAKRPRERRLRGVGSIVVIVTGDPPVLGGSLPSASNPAPDRTYSLADLATDLPRLLVAPPGRIHYS